MKHYIYQVYYYSNMYTYSEKMPLFVTYDKEMAERYIEKFNRKRKYWSDLYNSEGFDYNIPITLIHRLDLIFDASDALIGRMEIR